jgi:hypothetical protein
MFPLTPLFLKKIDLAQLLQGASALCSTVRKAAQLASAFIVSRVTNANMPKAQRKQGSQRDLLFA